MSGTGGGRGRTPTRRRTGDDGTSGKRGTSRRPIRLLAFALAVALVVPAFTGVGAATSAGNVSECTTIDSPGQYVMTSNLNSEAGGACVRITSDDVVLDGDGHTVDRSTVVDYEYYEADYSTVSTMPSFDSANQVDSGTTNQVALGASSAERSDNFAYRFVMNVSAPVQGEYTFYTNSDDGSRLYVDGTMVVDNAGIHAADTASGTITLSGGIHNVTVTYFEQSTDQTLSASWEGPGFDRQSLATPTSGVSIGSSVSNVTVQNLEVRNTEAGVVATALPSETVSDVTVDSLTTRNINDDAVRVNLNESTARDVTVSNSDLAAADDGFEADVELGNSTLDAFRFEGNDIDAGGDGILMDGDEYGVTVRNLTVIDNERIDSSGDGVKVEADEPRTAVRNVTIHGNEDSSGTDVITSGDVGIDLDLDGENTRHAGINVTDNEIGATGDAFTVDGDENAVTIDRVRFSGNDVNGPGGDGMYIDIDDPRASLANVTASNNDIDNADEAIEIEGDDEGVTVEGIRITDNNFNDSGGYGVHIDVDGDGSSVSDVVVSGNRIDDTGNEGIAFDAEQEGTVMEHVRITRNAFTDIGADAVQLESSDAGTEMIDIVVSHNSVGADENTDATGYDGIELFNGGDGARMERIRIVNNSLGNSSGGIGGVGVDVEIADFDEGAVLNDVRIADNGIIAADEAVEIIGDGGGTVAGQVRLINNTITSESEEGVRFDMEGAGARLTDVVMQDNTIDNAGTNAIEFDGSDNGQELEGIRVENNVIDSADGYNGVYVDADDDATTVRNFTLTNNDINASEEGVHLRGYSDAVTLDEIRITNNHIDSEWDGIWIEADGDATALTDFTLANNVINASENGIELEGDENGFTGERIRIAGNDVEAAYHGLLADIDDDSTLLRNATVTDNEFLANESSTDEAIEIAADADGATVDDLEIVENDEITSANDRALYVDLDDGFADGVNFTDVRIGANTLDADTDAIAIDAGDDGHTIEDLLIDGNDVNLDDDGVVPTRGMAFDFSGTGSAYDNVTVMENTIESSDRGIHFDDLQMSEVNALDLYVYGNSVTVDDPATESTGTAALEFDVPPGQGIPDSPVRVHGNEFHSDGDAVVVGGNGVDEIETLEIRYNVLDAGTGQYGVNNENGEAVVNATDNYWGASDGPSSVPSGDADAPFADPVDTTVLANGTGSGVTEGSTAGVSNVHFDPFLGAPPTPNFTVLIDGTNSPVIESEELRVTATIRNDGGLRDTQTIELTADGQVRDSTDVTLFPDESRTVTLVWDTNVGDSGTYFPTVASNDDSNDTDPVDIQALPNIEVSIDSTNSPVVAGGALDVTATITNTGGSESNVPVSLFAGGAERDSTEITLGSGESQTVTLTWGTSEDDAGGYSARVVAGAGSDSIDVSVQQPATFSVAIDSTNSPVNASETLSVDATITNTGAEAGSQALSLTRDGIRIDGTTLTLGSGESQTVTLSWATDDGDVGSHTLSVVSNDDSASTGVTVESPGDEEPAVEPANFSVSIVGTNTPVDANGAVNVIATVENEGNESGTRNVTLSVNGTERDSQSVTLGAGESRTLSLMWSTGSGDAGSYTATVDAEDDAASTEVVVRADSTRTALSVSLVGTNSPVTEGETLNVTAAVANVGGTEATGNVTLSINGTERGTVETTLPAGEIDTPTLSWATSEGDAGSYTATVATANDSTSTSVLVEPADTDEDGNETDEENETDEGNETEGPGEGNQSQGQNQVPQEYTNRNGDVGTRGVVNALGDWSNNGLSTAQLVQILDEWSDG